MPAAKGHDLQGREIDRSLVWASPNQAIYEENTPYDGALGFTYGPAEIQGHQVIALHPNGDGSVSGVTEEGHVVQI